MLMIGVVAAALYIAAVQATAWPSKQGSKCAPDRWYRNVECETCPEWIGYDSKQDCSAIPERYSRTSLKLETIFAASQLFPADLPKGPDVWLWWICGLNFCIRAPNPYMSPWPRNTSDYVQNHEAYDNKAKKPAPKAPKEGYATPLPQGQECMADKWYIGDDGKRWVKYDSSDRDGCREWETESKKILQLEEVFKVAQEADGMHSARTSPAWVCDLSACSLAERYST